MTPSPQRDRPPTDLADPDARSGILAALDELLSLAASMAAGDAHGNLAAARARVAEDRFNLVVLGEFKRGKSTLINALLERDVLPLGVVPLTSVVTAIGAGVRDRLIIHYTDGREQERPLAELAAYVTRGPQSRQPPGRRARAPRARSRATARRAGAGRHPRSRFDSQPQHRCRTRLPAPGGRRRVRARRRTAALGGRAGAVSGGRAEGPASADGDQQDRSPRPRRPRGSGPVRPLGPARCARRH